MRCFVLQCSVTFPPAHTRQKNALPSSSKPPAFSNGVSEGIGHKRPQNRVDFVDCLVSTKTSLDCCITLLSASVRHIPRLVEERRTVRINHPRTPLPPLV